MHRAGASLIFALLLSACGKQELPVVPPIMPSDSANAAREVAPTAGDAERLVRIDRFDCAKSAADDDGSRFPWAEGFRNWAGGGPGGAAWNAGQLRCSAELRTPCTQGTITVELHVGNRLVGERDIALTQAGVETLVFDVPAESWASERAQTGTASARLPYRSALFGISAIAECTLPEAFGPGTGPRLEYADQDSFMAGFATGE